MEAAGDGAQLLLRGNRLLVISGQPFLPPGVAVAVPGAAAIAPLTSTPLSPYYYGASTTVTEVDVHDPSAMSVARTMTVEGTFVDARQSGGVARLVFSSAPRAIATPALAARTAGWVPVRRFHSLITGHRYSRPLATCAQVRRPVAFSGVGMLSILTVNLDRGLYATDTTALMADAQLVYGSSSSLYVATQRWINPQTPADAVPSAPETVIDQFDASGSEHTPLIASGVVPGYLLNQFSLSQAGGLLRVASTSRPIWWSSSTPPPSQSYVTVLADRAGTLTPVGQLSGLGAGEQIYSVRFIGDTGYVVTFRRVDPLYTIDLSTPTAPRVAGQLELQGYSAYLQPAGEGLLLGVGQEVGPEHEPSGAQLELFDVSQPAYPRLLAHASLGAGSSSQVEYDHHALLFWPPTGLAVLPLTIYPPAEATPVTVPPAGAQSQAFVPLPTPAGGFTGAIGFHVDGSGITELGRITQDPVDGSSPQIERSLVIGSVLFTLSSEGIEASSLATLQRQAMVSFPSQSSSGSGSSGSSPGSPAPPTG